MLLGGYALKQDGSKDLGKISAMSLFCPVTNIKVSTDPEWINQKVSKTLTANFWLINDSIIYSRPEGQADLIGVQSSLSINDKLAVAVSGGEGPNIQIEDYHFLTGSSLAARKYYIDKMNDNQRITTLIFCNLSLQFSIAVKIGQRFNRSGKDIHVVRQYSDAIKRALMIRDQPESNFNTAPIDLSRCFEKSECYLSPIELLSEDAWNIQTPEYSNRAVVIDRCILHSTSEGYVESHHVELASRARSLCQSALPEGSTIEYIVVDCSKLKGGSRLARKKYMQSLKQWHQRFPITMYIAYGANTFMKTALHLASPLMPFKVKVAKDISHACHLIQKDRDGNLTKQGAIQDCDKLALIRHTDIVKVMAFIDSMNWEEKGFKKSIDLEESHPFYFLYQSIKLIKEEIDALFTEHKVAELQLAASLKEKEVLLREIHHRVKNNMQSIISLLRMHSRRTDDTHLKQIFDECRDRINAMSLIHEALYQSDDLDQIDFANYLYKLCRSLSQAHGASEKGITVKVERCNVSPSMDQGIAVGMVICELIANAFQHAFPPGKGGNVSISLTGTKGEQVELIVSDDGKGLPPGIDVKRSSSLGLHLVNATVTRELGGSIRVERKGGTQFIIQFDCKGS